MRPALIWTRPCRHLAAVIAVAVTACVTTACSPVAGHTADPSDPSDPTRAVVTDVTIADLPPADPGDTYYLSGQEIHTASGQLIPLRLGGSTRDVHGSTRTDVSLVGLSSHGYVVERAPGPYESGPTEAYLVTASSTRLLDRSPVPVRTTYLLSGDGTRLLRAVHYEHAFTRLTVLDLNGVPLASTNATGDSPWLLAVTRSAVWYVPAGGDDGIEAGLTRWDYQQGEGTVGPVHAVGWYVDPGHGLVFSGSEHEAGPTSTSDLSSLAWSHPFAPLTLSSDATRVAGVVLSAGDQDPAGPDAGATPTVEVRRVQDGALLASYAFPTGATFTDAWWDGDDAVLLAVSFPSSPYAGRLVRCALSGGCELVGSLVTGSYSHGPTFGWWRS